MSCTLKRYIYSAFLPSGPSHWCDTLFCEGEDPHPLRWGEEEEDDEARGHEESELAHRAAACARGRAVSTYALVARDFGRLGVSKRVEREGWEAGGGVLGEKFRGEKRGSGEGRTASDVLAARGQCESLQNICSLGLD